MSIASSAGSRERPVSGRYAICRSGTITLCFRGRSHWKLPKGTLFFSRWSTVRNTLGTRGILRSSTTPRGLRTIELLRGVDMGFEGLVRRRSRGSPPVSTKIGLLMKAEELHLCQLLAWDSRKGELAKALPDEPTVAFGEKFFCQNGGGDRFGHPGGNTRCLRSGRPPQCCQGSPVSIRLFRIWPPKCVRVKRFGST